ncbi:hypothetical protein [Rubrivirga marina]|uniref:DUF4156 domain-containing protein n=1 Tax=Rubrivirga marina TaxID=1196024 RepID=A0A271IYB2_9BACT|nr:hypothetical protein [Rubrivirga marina]PAP76120.1 hypothetical protein BSZ37_06500 [Rubrivirga marina]
MRSPFVPLVVLLVFAGCAGPSVVTASGDAEADGLDCALAEATARGYAVVGAEAGVFFRAHQPKRYSLGRRGFNEFDVVTATVARGRLTVLASGEQTSADGVQAIDPSGVAEDEARAVVAACTG